MNLTSICMIVGAIILTVCVAAAVAMIKLFNSAPIHCPVCGQKDCKESGLKKEVVCQFCGTKWRTGHYDSYYQ